MRRVRSTSGTTLVELMTVAAILGLLAAIAAPPLFRAKRAAIRSACQANQALVESAAELYRADRGEDAPPFNVDDLVAEGLLSYKAARCPAGGGSGASDYRLVVHWDESFSTECQVDPTHGRGAVLPPRKPGGRKSPGWVEDLLD
jgi:competence protein ComGC